MTNPIATYRLQFHHGFTFADAAQLVPYLQQLGIRTLYASPIFAATPGSEHGYDGIDPTRINPEIGTLDELRALNRHLRSAGIGWVQDIVPNHMAYSPDNAWLMDVLEKGPLSPYAPFFDSTGTDSLFRGRLMAPFLAGSLPDTIARGGLHVVAAPDRLALHVNGRDWPLHPTTYATVLGLGGQSPESRALRDALTQLLEAATTSADAVTWFGAAWDDWRAAFAGFQTTEAGALQLTAALRTINADPALLHELADAQTYRLCHGEETRQAINYRRFFTVDGLICLNVQHDAVFGHVHALIKQLLDEGTFTGLRVDHVDGLFDPTHYVARLRELAGPDAYIVVEKILELSEPLPDQWPIEGTSGYDFLATLNRLLTNARAEEPLTQFYHDLISTDTPVADRIRARKAFMLYQHMGGELNNLHRLLLTSDLLPPDALATVDANDLKLALGELLVQCPVYRYYGNQFPLDEAEEDALRQIFAGVRDRKPALETATTLLEYVLLDAPAQADDAYNARALHLYQRLMQFSGPLMAKGVEDTLLYTYNRFIGHNEVGGSPEAFGMPVEEFHQQMQHRQAHWPLAMSATATHDTKRGEDVRARLNVLTDLADEFLTNVVRWQAQNAELATEGIGPDANDAYFIYQTLLGAYPMPGDTAAEALFPERLRAYLTKAFSEAKRNTDWVSPNDDYLAAVHTFTDGLLAKNRPFWPEFARFQQRVAEFGVLNSLAQTMLKFTAPGIPDTYQGCESWDLSLVDPDNRRPVDYAQRQQWLTEITTETPTPDARWANRFSGKSKLWLTHKLLQERSERPDLYAWGHYVPLRVGGAYQANVVAFARRLDTAWAVVVVPLNLASLCRQQQLDNVVALDWADTYVELPTDAPQAWTNTVAGNVVERNSATTLPLRDALTTLPLALLRPA